MFPNRAGMIPTPQGIWYPRNINQREFPEPGLVNVEIANRTPNTINCQLLLMFAESCKLIDEDTRQRDWKQAIASGGATNG